MKKLNRLWGMRCYLAGPMDRVPDGGVVWRQDITPFLQSMGTVVFDPCDKPIQIGIEDEEHRQQRREWKIAGEYDKVQKDMKLIRNIDMRLVDKSDYVILYIDTDVHMCGSYEEDSWANRLKSPIIVVCKQGKVGVPDWMYGKIPHEFFFDNFEQAKEYLRHVDEDEDVDHMRRWIFFDYKKLLPKV